MGSIRKINGEYYIEFTARGLRYQQKAGQSRTDAEKLLAETEAKIAKGEMGILVRDADVKIFLVDFLEFARREYPAVTAKRFEMLVKHFTKFLTKRKDKTEKLSGITPAVLEEYRLGLMKSVSRPAVINLTLILLREIFEYARKAGLLNDNPMLHIRYLSDLRHRLAVIPEGESGKKFMASFSESQKDAVEFMLLTGCRPSEVTRLRWEHIDWSAQKIILKGREFPLDFALKEFLLNLKKTSGPNALVFAHYVRKTDERLSLEKAIQKCGKDILRNTFACRFLHKVPSLFILARLLGVQDIARVIKYTECLARQSTSVYFSPHSIGL